ncbi:oligosaccharide flippase family protein [Paracandidimonas soli]|uniref:PST family polysaccharide transporter n=1 Tax=Paracandidimonas soli TaxID=1917182 RepID=A0A4R3V0S9_9BURK|nr:oligosaccharide flippase family protein [Paracandidimonas soli]TCU98306.1 PST family polysaccharide transporter [Paracandidimonas soli]
MANKHSKVLVRNTAFLFLIQIANYAIPLLMLPYLARVLGVAGFGIAVFGLSMLQIALVITDYGFSLSATLSISKKRDDKDYLERILGAVFVCKIFLVLICFLIFSIFLFVHGRYIDYWLYFLLLVLPLIGQSFQPIWFYQGIEKMGYITIYTIFSRIVYLILVVFLVKSKEDIYYIAVSNGLGTLVALFIGVFLLYKLGYKPKWGGYQFTKVVFKESSEFFLSRAAVSTYTAGGVFFLGVFSSPIQIALYSVAEQLYRGAQSIFSPVAQALLPYMAKHRNYGLFFKILKIAIVLALFGVIVGIFLGKEIIVLLFGVEFIGSYEILLVFLICFSITVPSVLLGYPFLGALGDVRTANRSVIYGGLLQVLLLGVCYVNEWILALHISLTVILVESLVLCLRAYKSRMIYHTLTGEHNAAKTTT